jgi:hypothetical protein
MLYARWTRCVALFAWCLLGAAATATAQLEQGRLAGTVTDAQGAVLPGVSVTA